MGRTHKKTLLTFLLGLPPTTDVQVERETFAAVQETVLDYLLQKSLVMSNLSVPYIFPLLRVHTALPSIIPLWLWLAYALLGVYHGYGKDCFPRQPFGLLKLPIMLKKMVFSGLQSRCMLTVCMKNSFIRVIYCD